MAAPTSPSAVFPKRLPWVKCCLTKPLVFPFRPRPQGQCGCAKYLSASGAALTFSCPANSLPLSAEPSRPGPYKAPAGLWWPQPRLPRVCPPLFWLTSTWTPDPLSSLRPPMVLAYHRIDPPIAKACFSGPYGRTAINADTVSCLASFIFGSVALLTFLAALPKVGV